MALCQTRNTASLCSTGGSEQKAITLEDKHRTTIAYQITNTLYTRHAIVKLKLVLHVAL